MKRIAKKSVFIELKGGRDYHKKIRLVEGKPVVQSKLDEMTTRQINEYTEEVFEANDLSFLTPEDKKFYNKNKKDPDIQWALDILHG
jgi:hypothetical protein